VAQYFAEYLFFSCLLGAILWLPGCVLLATVFGKWDLNGLRTLAGICLGLAVWVVSLFALAAAGQLHRWSLLLLCAGWLIAGITLHFRRGVGLGILEPRGETPARLADNSQDHSALCLPPAKRRSALRSPNVSLRGSIPWAVLLALVLVPCLLRAMIPEVMWDAGVYHLTLPKLYIAHGGFRPVEFNVYSNWPLNAELLFAAAMLVKDYVLATLVHFGFGVLILYAIGVCCRSAGHRRSIWLAVFLFLGNRTVLMEMGLAYIDLAYTFFFLAGFVFILRALDDQSGRRTWLLLSGLCCGILAGTKLTGIAGAAAIGALLLPGLVARGRSGLWAEVRTILAWFILPVFALFVPWLVKTAWFTGNPVYPFLYGWLGGPDWSPALSAQFAAWHKRIGMGHGLVDYLLLPLRVILMGDEGYAHFAGRICWWWVLLIPTAIVFGRKEPLVRRCLAAAGLYFVLWSVSSQQIRFLIPILPLLAIASAVTVYRLLDSVRNVRRRSVFASGCLVLTAIAAVGVNLDNSARAIAFLIVLNRQGTDIRQKLIEPIYGFVDSHLPANARVLYLNANHGFFLNREYLADSFFEASQIVDWLRPASNREQVRNLLAARGITHVLIYNKDWGIAYPPAFLELLDDPAQSRVIYRSDDGRLSLAKLTPSAAPTSQASLP
jgi:hypothetical protein